MPTLLAPRYWGAHLLALGAVSVTVLLGLWQLESWQAVREDSAADLTREQPEPLAAVIGPDDPFPGEDVGQPVVVAGTWLPESTVYVSGRESDGRDGYWVVTPLAIGEPDGPALPIVRGWTADVETAPAPPTGTAELVAWLQPTEGTNVADEDRTDDILPQVRTADLIQHVDQDLYGAYAIVADEVAPGDWPTGAAATNDGTAGLEPAELDQLPTTAAFSGLRNFLYALEWFMFGGFVVFLWWRWARDTVALERRVAEEVAAGAAADGSSVAAGGAVAGTTTLLAPAEVRRSLARRRGSVGGVNRPLLAYRVMAYIVGVLLIVLCLIGVPLGNFDGSSMWGIFPSTPELVSPGSGWQEFGEAISGYLGVAHGWLYMIFLGSAFFLARREGWEPTFTIVTLLCGTIPVLSFWAEHRAVQRVRADEAADLAEAQAAGAQP
ncbi:SURF1 family cytochrome oxidase biogenesis protein [Nocardioides pantholopis]|uniref:SURF1 family cytochrome oxidase biogenesis protein n=1 Tax=Nocardioides pantholopis TaxID=2483798 RepID=UPI000FDCC130|nr:SURF1 family cytochrome oxidase biogenesis protein [Nocardioides pantholopis]